MNMGKEVIDIAQQITGRFLRTSRRKSLMVNEEVLWTKRAALLLQLGEFLRWRDYPAEKPSNDQILQGMFVVKTKDEPIFFRIAVWHPKMGAAGGAGEFALPRSAKNKLRFTVIEHVEKWMQFPIPFWPE